MTDLSLDFVTLRRDYAEGRLRPLDLVQRILDRIDAAGDDKVWISRPTDDALRGAAIALEKRLRDEGAGALPLYGIPFAVKDNIDVAGLPTTAGCPDFAYWPDQSASVVDRLLAAGALFIGKTNLDQFATGLVGTRSPYGVSRNPFNPDYIPGGSSSGSAVAVSAGLVSFALGTDTAGSGRVPAGFNNIVGLKPTKGRISTGGMVPACRSLDCVSIFALTVDDAMDVLEIAQGYDPRDAYSRPIPDFVPGIKTQAFRFGIPAGEQLQFHGNQAAAQLFAGAVETLGHMGGTGIPIDYAGFAEAAGLLYGPLVAERMAALGAFLTEHADSMHPVVRHIIEAGQAVDGAATWKALYRLEALRQQIRRLWAEMDVLLVPTTPTIYRIAEVEADPIRLNSNLGRYTNFLNLLDLSAIAIPNGFQPDGLPAGITLIAPAWQEAALAGIAAEFQARRGLTLGATGAALPARIAHESVVPEDRIALAVVGAHLSGMPLNHELVALGAVFDWAGLTAPHYRLIALPDGLRPGLIRMAEGGKAFAVEVWTVPASRLGGFIARIAPPLGVGSIDLADGRRVLGFLCEAYAAAEALDISDYTGWRQYRAG